MAFGDLLEQVGGTGRFQIVHVSLLCLPVMLMASHNLLQNFAANVPRHYCNAHENLTQSRLSPEEKLLITVPLDQHGKPVKCRRYTEPQWHLLAVNGTLEPEQYDYESDLDADLQECPDGWFYDMTDRSSTIISEVRLCLFFLPPPNVHISVPVRSEGCSTPGSGIWCVTSAL